MIILIQPITAANEYVSKRLKRKAAEKLYWNIFTESEAKDSSFSRSSSSRSDYYRISDSRFVFHTVSSLRVSKFLAMNNSGSMKMTLNKSYPKPEAETCSGFSK